MDVRFALPLLLLPWLAALTPATATVDASKERAAAGLEKRLKRLQRQIKQLSDGVAFTAHDDSYVHLDRDEALVLGTVTLNAGGGYDNTTGAFTAPRSGLYHVTLHALCWANAVEHFLELKVQCNSHTVRRTVLLVGAWCPSGSGTTPAGNAAAVRLRRGDACQVRCGQRSGMAVYTAGRASTTTFSAHLIAPAL